MKTTRTFSALLSGFSLLAVSGAAQAAYMQNFDTLNPGAINGQDGWGGAGTVQSTVAVSGQALALTATGEGPYRAGVFVSSNTMSPQRLQFDLQLSKTIADFAGIAGQSIQQQILVRGPEENELFYIIYRGSTGSADPDTGVVPVTENTFQFRGSSATWTSLSSPQKNTWYHIEVDLSTQDKGAGTYGRLGSGTFVGRIYQGNTLLTGANNSQTFYGNGNYNGIGFTAQGGDTASTVYVDNLSTGPVPEPASLGLLGLGAVAMLRRTRK